MTHTVKDRQAPPRHSIPHEHTPPAALQRFIDAWPDLVTARLNGRTVLHVVTDWPGEYPNGPDTVRMLVAAGADPNAGTGVDAPETPLHWASRSDDLDVADALIDAGADLETPKRFHRRPARQRARRRGASNSSVSAS
jgi:Ankyrin repeats (3 copies)